MTREYMDETVLKVVQAAEDRATDQAVKAALAAEVSAQDLAGGQVLIDGQSVRFAPREFYGGRVKIIMPEEWNDMDSAAARQKYPYEARPPIIQTDETTTFNLTLNHIRTPLSPQNLTSFIDTMKMLMDQRLKLQFIGQGQWENPTGGPVIGWFDFISPGLDQALYNFVFCTTLDATALLLTFNCLSCCRERWNSVGRAMMETLEITDSTQNNEGGMKR